METSEIALDGASVLARNHEIVLRRSGGEIIALDASRGLFFTLNETAEFILGRLDGTIPLDAVRTALMEEFEVEADLAGEAVMSIARDFLGKNFAHVIPSD